MTVFDNISGSYYSYSLQREIKDSTHDEAMDEDMSGSEFYSLKNLPFPVLFCKQQGNSFCSTFCILGRQIVLHRHFARSEQH